MKRLFVLLAFVFALLSVEAQTTVIIDLKDVRLSAAPYYTNRIIWVQTRSVPSMQSPSVVLGATVQLLTDTNGQCTLFNAQPYVFVVTVRAPPNQEQFAFLVTATNLGTIYAADNLCAFDTATFPAGSVAWAAAVSDARYSRGSNAPVSYFNVTNALGYVPQPSSVNLTNWSLLPTNALQSGVAVIGTNGIIVTTNGNLFTASLYSPPVVSSFTNNENVLEIGTTVSTTLLGWTLSGGAITSQSLNQGIGALGTGVRGYSDGTSYTVNRTYTLTVSDGTTSPTASTSVVFESKIYWGVSANTSLNDAQVIALSQQFATTRVQTFNGVVASAQYLYFAYPAAFGDASFNVNGLLNTDWTLVTRAFLNASGGLVSYNIYRSNNLLTGTYNVAIN